MRRVALLLIVVLFAIVAAMLALRREDGDGTVQSSMIARAGQQNIEGFTRAEGPRQFSFPQDHGPHNDFQTEWWYYTGNLGTSDGRRFGYQLTFFRRALLPSERIPARVSSWATSQVYMAHFAISDIDGQNYQAFERLSRGAADLAGAQGEPFQVWIEDWRVEQTDANPLGCANPCGYRLTAAQGDIRLELRLKDLKGPVLQGDVGYSRKGSERGQASYYYSLPRLETSGTIEVDGQLYSVNGLSWMDHEFSTSALSRNQVGWDWFSIQMDDGSELMVFQIRRSDGSIDPFSSGAFIRPDGTTLHLEIDDFNLEVGANWKSQASGATYPAEWILNVPSLGLRLQIEPLLADQELNLSYAYWEGAVTVTGSYGHAAISGKGYVELTGYSGSMGGKF
jgi:predicted secreted hydrolase